MFNQGLGIFLTDYLGFAGSLSLTLFTLIIGIFAALRNPLSNEYSSDKVKNTLIYQDVSKKAARGILFFLVLLAGYFRITGYDFGLPAFFHPDEVKKFYTLSAMVKEGRLDPKIYLHPPMLLYLSYLVHLFREIVLGEGNIILLSSGRIMSGIFGTLTIIPLYKLLRLFFARIVSLFSLLIYVFSPIAIDCAHYMKEDTIFVFISLLSLYFAIKAVQTNRQKYHNLTFFFLGITLGTKYTGLLTIFCAGLFYLLNLKKVLVGALKGAPLFFVGLLVGFPFLFTDISAFGRVFSGFMSELTHSKTGHHGLVLRASDTFYSYYLTNSLIPGMEMIPFLISIFGAGMALGHRYLKLIYIIIAVTVFYFVSELSPSKPFPQVDRYVLHCVPLLVILFGYGVRNIVLLFGRVDSGRAKIFGISVLTLVIAPIAIRAFNLISIIQNDTRTEAYEWMVNNMPAKTKVISVGFGLYLPSLPPSIEKIKLPKVGHKNKYNFKERLKDIEADYLVISKFDSPSFRFLDKLNEDFNGSEKALDNLYERRIVFANPYGSYGFHSPTVILYDLGRSK